MLSAARRPRPAGLENANILVNFIPLYWFCKVTLRLATQQRRTSLPRVRARLALPRAQRARRQGRGTSERQFRRGSAAPLVRAESG